MVSMVVVLGFLWFRRDYSIRYCIAVLVSVSIKSCGVGDSVSFLSDFN